MPMPGVNVAPADDHTRSVSSVRDGTEPTSTEALRPDNRPRLSPALETESRDFLDAGGQVCRGVLIGAFVLGALRASAALELLLG